jgi:cob(I)alamin adenosyltransferase
MKIYTKTGDGGKTSLLGGTRISKSSYRVECYGTVDELNAHIGMLKDLIETDIDRLELKEIQDRLFTIGSSLACDPEKELKMRLPDLNETDVVYLENAIDRMNEQLEPMRFFILPGGGISISQAHICRTVCRRAERLCVGLAEQGDFIDESVIKYLNRLSDYLFVKARYIAKLNNIQEVAWKPRSL